MNFYACIYYALYLVEHYYFCLRAWLRLSKAVTGLLMVR